MTTSVLPWFRRHSGETLFAAGPIHSISGVTTFIDPLRDLVNDGFVASRCLTTHPDRVEALRVPGLILR